MNVIFSYLFLSEYAESNLFILKVYLKLQLYSLVKTFREGHIIATEFVIACHDIISIAVATKDYLKPTVYQKAQYIYNH